MDDILILALPQEEAISSFNISNNTDPHIELTIEHLGNSGILAFLDFSLNISEDGNLSTKFYKKSACRDLVIHYKSSLPHKTKIGYVKNEITCIHNKFSKKADKNTCTSKSHQVLETNGYPTPPIKNLNKPWKWMWNTFSNPCFLKLLYFNDRITTAIHREGLDILLIQTRLLLW